MTPTTLLSGAEAAARAAFEAGASFVCGYPGTPATEILAAAESLPPLTVQRATNEKVALEVAIGIARGGRRALAVLRHDGLNIASDPIIAAAYAGVGGGLVILTIDDPGLLTSMSEQDTRHFARAARIPMFAPSDAQETLEFTRLAFTLSERHGMPVLVRLTSRLCFTRSICMTGDPIEPVLRDSAPEVPKSRQDGLKRHERLEQQLTAIESFGNQAFELNTVDVGSPDVGIITSGISYAYAKEVLPEASFLKLGMIHPLPKKLLTYFASLVERVYVIEELDPFLEEQIRALGITVTGKDVFPRTGELSADIVARGLAPEGVTPPRQLVSVPPPPVRENALCEHCAHHGLVNVFRRLGLDVVGDVGCHTPGDLPPATPGAHENCLSIGSSVSMSYGMSLARANARNTVAVLSGATFMHSGLPALANIVAGGGSAVVCLLAAPARTNGAPVAPQPDFQKLCEAIGVGHIQSVATHDEPAIEAALTDALARDGVSVIISIRNA